VLTWRRNFSSTHCQLEQLLKLGTDCGLTDSELLEQFVAGSEESASLSFETLVQRHGSMVLGVCRAILSDTHAADDALQATFLILARKALAISSRDRLGNWLHGVAARTAPKAKAMATRRQLGERPGACSPSLMVVDTPDESDNRDVELVLHQEIGRLPRAYRSAVVFFDLEGTTHAQAAQELGLAESTIRGRLARARKLLRRRLTHRGVGLSMDPLVWPSSTIKELSSTAIQQLARSALMFIKRNSAVSRAMSATAHDIAEGVLSTM
jgi:RNA polymerase sigma factor (sigma-70 family)